MDFLANIIADNKLVVEALEKVSAAIRRAADKICERVGRGGKVFTVNAASPVPEAYSAREGLFTNIDLQDDSDALWGQLEAAGAKGADVVVAVENGKCPAALSQLLRSCRRKGMLIVCINSNAPQTAPADVSIAVEPGPLAQNRRIMCDRACRMALDSLLTLVLHDTGYPGSVKASEVSDFLTRAAEALQAEIPALGNLEALALISKYGSVRRAANAYQKQMKSSQDVQAEL